MHPSPTRRWLGALLLALAGLMPARASAQQTTYTIIGTVVDAATRSPIADATVQLRTGAQGSVPRTVTDAAGRYTLRAPLAAGTYTIEATQLGRSAATRQITLGASAAVQVEPLLLSSGVLQLEEVVVTGTGAPVERREVGNTVSSVSGEEIARAPAATSIDQALQGRIAGAQISESSGQPGGGVSIRLRGTNTILGNAEPLIVIDGVIVDNNNEALIGLGANATRSNTALTNRLSDIPPDDIERVEVLKGAAAAALYGSRANSGVIQIFTRRGRSGTPQIRFSTEMQASRTPGFLDLNMEPLIGPADVAADASLRPRLGQPVERYDIQDRIFQTGYGTSNQLSVSGGTTTGTSYYLSGNWNEEDGIVRSTGYRRYGGRARVSQRLSNWLEVGVNGSYLRTRTNLVPEGEQTQGILTSVVFTPTYFNPAAIDSVYGRYAYSPVIGTNVLDVIENWKAQNSVTRFLGNVQATATPLRNLTLTYLAGVDDGREEAAYLQPFRATSVAFTGSLQAPVRSVRRFNNDFTAALVSPLRPGVELNSVAGFRYTDDRTNTIRAGASSLLPGATLANGPVQTASQTLVQLRTMGGYIQERLSLADRLFLTAGVNMEASSAFGADQRWQAFPRVSASYVVDEQPGFSEGLLGSVFSGLRLRAAYGQTGGQPPSEYLNQVTYTNVAYGGLSGLRPPTLAPSPDLKPERQREYEFGADASFLGDRLAAELTYYDKRTSDLVLSVPLATTSGFATQFRNVGELTNRGVEASFSSANVQRENFRWNTRLLLAHNRNRIERLNQRSDTITFEYLNAVVEGQPLGVFLGRVYPRDANGNIIYSAAGTPVGARDTVFNASGGVQSVSIRRRVLGDPNPDLTASLSNNFTIRGVEVGVLFDGRFGNDVANFTRRSADYFGSSPNAGVEARGDTIVGTFVRNNERNLLYEEFIEDGSFVKLREISLGFRFDQPWVRRFGASDMGLRVAARNLYTWTDYSGIDPEVNVFAASTVARGVDFSTTPIPRTLVVGLDFNF
ncbi:SusC/RagA family TonB-linked outer membrane protein [Longimicrobium terrae]|uniref:TonB-linked SusC/RagA family outer membrane protein n=1 Tax=Longimicrobium terrae TaxID=1639882 RepID=A0A841GZT9_9BACT|nr:SusC/RagA family TonB-linked outer membrane protein [Longimicrobium terrae]MBB4636767.1 TonB-linked SusC/RagA family outer membrane protein [Longimicrobium terrae]MBB6071234.1 TonB-linked SusC/RagA family outer membrane protein [Longimicrobium terrae]NNC29280.1 SusC/RagA family TonB-linked outer membrane protein [Longimicrobium terrae]